MSNFISVNSDEDTVAYFNLDYVAQVLERKDRGEVYLYLAGKDEEFVLKGREAREFKSKFHDIRQRKRV